MRQKLTILTEPKDVVPFAETAAAAADTDKEALGFFPAGVFHERALQGKLLIAASAGVYRGHLMFRGRMPILRVDQLFVLPEHRGEAVAKLLVNALANLGENLHYTGISARVAEELEANRFWEKCGFEATATVPGGQSRNRRIVVREKRLRTPTLFEPLALHHSLGLDIPPPARSLYAIDVNVLLDLAKNRPRAGAVRKIMNAAFSGRLRLFATPELDRELARAGKQNQAIKDDPVLQMAAALPKLSKQEDLVHQNTVDEVAAELFPARVAAGTLRERDKSDAAHLATVARTRNAVYVTSDDDILQKSRLLFDRFGLEVIGTEELAANLELAGALNPQSAGTAAPGSVSRIEIMEVSIDDAKRFLTEQRAPSAWIDTISDPSQPCVRRLVVADGHRAALIAWRPPSRFQPDVDAWMVIDGDHPVRETAVERALWQLALSVCAAYPAAIRLRIWPTGDPALNSVAQSIGFRSDKELDHSMAKIALGRVVLRDDWPAARHDIERLSGISLDQRLPSFARNRTIEAVNKNAAKLHIRLDELEQLLGPSLLILEDRPCAIVPIRRRFADALLGIPDQSSLFDAYEAGSCFERTYFCRPTALRVTGPGTILLFYESSRSGGRAAVVGCARSVETSVQSSKAVEARYRTRGVLEDDHLSEIAGRVDCGIITFDSVFHFRNPVPIAHLRKTRIVDNRNLITSQAISLAQAEEIIRFGQPYV